MIASKTTEWHYNNLCKEIQRYVKWTLEKECLFYNIIWHIKKLKEPLAKQAALVSNLLRKVFGIEISERV